MTGRPRGRPPGRRTRTLERITERRRRNSIRDEQRRIRLQHDSATQRQQSQDTFNNHRQQLTQGPDTTMNLNYETYIKQEFLNEEDDLNSTLAIADSNIPIKNEPISDEIMPLVTIKNEPLNETILTEVVAKIKNEDPVQNQIPIPGNSFIVYELETPSITQHVHQVKNTPKSREFINEVICSKTQLNSIHNVKHTPQIAANSKTALNPLHSITQTFQLTTNPDTTLMVQPCQNQASNNIATKLATKAASPVLLNAQLRKHNKVVVHTISIDKRARYNIEGVKRSVKDSTTASIKATDPTLTSKASSVGEKKIINHLIKSKRNQRKLEYPKVKRCQQLENKKFINESVAAKNKNPLMEFNDKPSESIPESLIKFNANKIKTKTDSAVITMPALVKHLDTHKETSSTPELRVKCLCSLTADTSNNLSNNLEMRNFFKEMFEKTRRLSKKQQRKIKMILLQAILDAEESVEKGKCCGF